MEQLNTQLHTSNCKHNKEQYYFYKYFIIILGTRFCVTFILLSLVTAIGMADSMKSLLVVAQW